MTPETIIDCDGEPIGREMEEVSIDNIDFANIMGLEDVKQALKEFVRYPIEHQEKYLQFGMTSSRGMLLYGPSGCGKVLF